ncbi:MAG: lipoprotein-releasing system permease protein [Chthoniobacter sp.]|nr:lipoprotein-releasing system permease protein [Chthoniobacter sp.]
MKAPFSLFLALRYLKPKRTFVSIITLISILGVTVGIMVLIIVIAVMTGFDQELRRKVLGFEPHVVVTNSAVLNDWRGLAKKIEAIPGVTAVAPFVQGPVIAEHEDRVVTPMVRGIDLAAEEKITELCKLVKPGDGAFDLDGDSVVIGRDLADQMGVGVGDTITIYAPGNIRGVLEELKKEGGDGKKKKTIEELKDEVVLPAELTITGIFTSGRYVYDSNVMFIPLTVGQELYTLRDGVHGLSVETTGAYRAEEIKRAINAMVEPPAFAETWIDRNRDLFDAIRVERNVMFIILLFISIVASFCVMNTLITVTVMKTREIGIMKALGATTAQIVWVFLAQGMVVGIFGNLTGLGLGMLLIRFRNEFRDWLASTLHIQIFPADIYQFSQIPAEIVPHDVMVICLTAFAFCSLAALIPAWVAARLEPVKALRYE